MKTEGSHHFIDMSLADKNVHLFFRSPYETKIFLHGLRRTVETEREIKRTFEGVLRYNVSTLYFYFSAKMDSQIQSFVNSLLVSFEMSKTPLEISKSLKSLATEIGYLCDAFYARKPFVLALLELILKLLHRQVREFLQEYWNKFYKGFQAGDIMLISSGLSAYELKLEEWKVTDGKFSWSEPINTTLINRLFQNSLTPLVNIIEDLRSETFTEGSRLHSTSVQQLESHMCFLWSTQKDIPLISFAEKLLTLVSKFLLCFFVTSYYVLTTQECPPHVHIAVLNSSFIKIVKSFEKRVHRSTKSQLSLSRIKQLLDENYLLSLVCKIDMVALKKLKALWRAEVKSMVRPPPKFLEFDFQKAVVLMVVHFDPYLKLVDPTSDVPEQLSYTVYDELLSVYVESYIASANSASAKQDSLVTKKLKSDSQFLTTHLENGKGKLWAQNVFKMNQLRLFHSTDQLSECIVSISNLQIFYLPLCDIKQVSQIMRYKFFFPAVLVQQVIASVQQSLEAQQSSNKGQRVYWLMKVLFLFTRLRVKIKQLSHKPIRVTPHFTRITFTPQRDTLTQTQLRPKNIVNLFTVEGWVNVIKFDLKVDDLDVEAYLLTE